MSSCTVESFLFKLCNDPNLRAEFTHTPELVLNRFPFTSKEHDDCLVWNVRALADGGASPMLLMFGFTAMYGMEQGLPEYIRRMKAGADLSSPLAIGDSHG